MKKLLCAAIALLSIYVLNAQKPKLEMGEFVKHKKSEKIRGILNINGDPFLLIDESRGLILDYTATFYPIENNINLGENIRQKNLNVEITDLPMQKCLFITSVINAAGKTIVFYAKREKNDVGIYQVEMDEDCQVIPRNAEEVMRVKISRVFKHLRFAVRQSPDKSKVLAVGMSAGTNKSSKYTFKVYSGNMKKVIWEKTIKTARTNEPGFKGSNPYSNTKEVNSILHNNFLINNEGRVFFLRDKENNSGKKHEIHFVSFDLNGEKMTEAELPFKGEYYVQYTFKLNHRGNANLIMFYSQDKAPAIEVANEWGQDINALLSVEYDGNKTNVVADYELTEDQQGEFYPSKFRKSKTDYRIGAYEVSKTIDLPNGEMAMLLEQSIKTVGTERPFSNTAHGFVCVAIFDSMFNIKSLTPIVATGSLWPSTYHCGANIFMHNGKLLLMYNDADRVMNYCFLDEEDPKPVAVGKKIKDAGARPAFMHIIYHKGSYLIPITRDKHEYAVCELKLE